MNELTEWILNELAPNDSKIDTIIAIYPGRFQPMGAHHAKTYKWLAKKFGEKNTFVGTSDVVSLPKSPFNFNEKKKIINSHGIKNVVQVKNPYKAKEILGKYDPETTAAVFMVGSKDAGRLGGKFFRPWKGKAQVGYRDGAYLIHAPHVSMNVPGFGEMSGTQIRKALGSDTEDKQKLFKGIFGHTKNNIYNLIVPKLEKLSEVIENFVISLNNDILSEGSYAGNLSGSEVDDGPRFFYGNKISYETLSKKMAERLGYEVVDYLLSGVDTEDFRNPYPKGPIQSVSFYPSGVAGKTTPTNQQDWKGAKAYNAWKKHITKIAGTLGMKFVNWLSADDSKKTSRTEPNKVEKTPNIEESKLKEKFMPNPEEDSKWLEDEDEEIKLTFRNGVDVSDINDSLSKEYFDKVFEEIMLPVEIGDTVYMGKWKNKRVVVKTVEWNEKGDLLINGKSAMKMRIPNKSNVFGDDPRYTDKEETNESLPTKLTDKIVPIKVVTNTPAEEDFLVHHKGSMGAKYMGSTSEPETYDFDDDVDTVAGTQDKEDKEDTVSVGYEPVTEVISKQGDKWVVKSKAGKVLGTHDTETSAKKQLTAIEISKHENINEAKQVGTIYHYTDKKGLAGILKSNSIKTDKESYRGAELNYISFTRNKNFHKKGMKFSVKTEYRIAIDGNKLSNNYKIKPFAYLPGWDYTDNWEYDWLEDEPESVAKDFFNQTGDYDEQEERITTKNPSKISNIKNYIISVDKVSDIKESVNEGLLLEGKSAMKMRIKPKTNESVRGRYKNLQVPNALLSLEDEKIQGDTIQWKMKFKNPKRFPVLKKALSKKYNPQLEHEVKIQYKSNTGELVLTFHEDDEHVVYSSLVYNGFFSITEGLLTESLLLEGGAYGHMAHPFDDKELKFADIKKMIDLGLQGKLDVESSVTEKTDGQNLMVTWKDGKLKAARNKSTIKEPMDINAIKSKFAGRGDIEKAFVYAMKDLEKAVGKLSDKQKEKIFKGGRAFMNLEIIYPATENVIVYDSAVIQFHGALEYDENANVLGPVAGSATMLQGMIKQVNADVQKHFKIIKPQILNIKPHNDYTTKRDYFFSKLKKLQKEFNLKDQDTLGLYHQMWWESYIRKQAKNFIVPESVVKGLTKRWAFFDKSFRLDKKNITDEKFLEWAKSFDKKSHTEQVKKNMLPFETLIFEVGSEILKNVSNYLSASPDKAVQKIKDEIAVVAKDIEKGGDLTKLKKLKQQLEKINKAGGLKQLVPSEGLVFVYQGKTFKITGLFGPINQILGTLKFG